MKVHNINSQKENNIFSETFELLPPSVLYRRGKYIFAVVEFDGADRFYIDKRRYKRRTNKARKLYL